MLAWLIGFDSHTRKVYLAEVCSDLPSCRLCAAEVGALRRRGVAAGGSLNRFGGPRAHPLRVVDSLGAHDGASGEPRPGPNHCERVQAAVVSDDHLWVHEKGEGGGDM